MSAKTPDRSVSDQDLHAFVDGELDGPRYREVVQRLAVDPYAAERVSAILRQQGGFALLREHLADVEPGEDEQAKELARRLAGTLRHQRRVRLTSLASILSVSLLVGSWALWGPDPGTVAGRLSWNGKIDHGPQVLFGSEPFERGQLAASEATDLSAVFDRQLAAYAVRRPDLAAHGLSFTGGDMLKGGQTPAVRLVYEDVTGQQVFLFIGTVGDQDDVALTLVPEGHVSLNWRRGPLVFALIGPKESEELLQVMRSTGDFLVPVPELRPELPTMTPGGNAVMESADAVTSGTGLVPMDPSHPVGGGETLLPSADPASPMTPAPVPDTSPKTL